MSILFEPFTINSLTVKNRIIRSATVDNLGKNMVVSDAQLELYRELARGEIGLIISSGLFPSLDGWSSPGQLGIHDDSMIPSLSKLVDIVHKNGGIIAAQLMHAGWFANPEISGQQNIGPSAISNPVTGRPVRELSSDEVYEHIDQFVLAARRAIESGFDAVQIHGAHNWLVSAFLSPATNLRDDEWGGSQEKRIQFVSRMITGIRKLAGPDYPILIKLGLKDYHSRGKAAGEGIFSASKFAECGIDAFEMSEGVEGENGHHIRLDAMQPYYIDECRQARSVLNKPLILIGGMRKLSDMEEVVRSGTADAVSMCRPFIMDQHIVKKFHSGEIKESGCISCNKCLDEMRNNTFRCVFNEKLIHF